MSSRFSRKHADTYSTDDYGDEPAGHHSIPHDESHERTSLLGAGADNASSHGSDDESSAVIVRHKISFVHRYGYGVGHVFNDLAASCWFAYTLVFFHKVVSISSPNAGVLIMIGQAADAAATPIVGYLSDKSNFRYGRRKGWHLLGSILVTISFPFIMIDCLLCDWIHSTSAFVPMLYYSFFIIVFQFGWAAVQVAHLALAPEMSVCTVERTGLYSIRSAMTVFCSVFVFGIAWILLGVQTSGDNITPADEPAFRNLGIICTGVGIVFTILFHIFTPEKTLKTLQSEREERLLLTGGGSDEASGGDGAAPITIREVDTEGNPCQESEDDDANKAIAVDFGRKMSTKSQHSSWRDWLRRTDFYVVGLIYMCIRLIFNVSQVYLSLYLLDSLQAPSTSIAQVPLALYAASCLTSMAMKQLSRKFSRLVLCTWGIVFVVLACIGFFLLAELWINYWQIVYGVSVILGIGNAAILVVGLGLVADLLGDDCSAGAFVYGVMSLADKMSNGIAVIVVQFMDPCANHCDAHVTFYRDIIALIPFGGCFFTMVGVLWMWYRMPVKNPRLDAAALASAAKRGASAAHVQGGSMDRPLVTSEDDN